MKLTSFDAEKTTDLQCNASQNGIGYCLMQEKPIAYGSQALTEQQKEWCQIEKEMLAITAACKKLHNNLIHGHKIVIQTDHQPLVSIFKKELSKITNLRLRRMRIKLLMYNLEVKFIPGKKMHIADLL